MNDIFKLNRVEKYFSILSNVIPAYGGLCFILSIFTIKKGSLYQITFLEGSRTYLTLSGIILFLVAIVYLVRLIRNGFDFSENKIYNVLYCLVMALSFMMLGLLAKPNALIDLIFHGAIFIGCLWFFIMMTRIKLAAIFQ